jgi:hypothetical protein
MSTEDHNKGEQDYSKGDYNPPYPTFIEEMAGALTEGVDGVNKANEDYDKGWENAKEQDES